MKLIERSYSFQIKSLAVGGSYFTQNANLTIVPNCELEDIVTNQAMPNSTEDKANYYKMIDGYPVLFLNSSCQVLTKIDIRHRFYSRNEWFCNFEDFKISKVQYVLSTGLTTLPDNMYKNIMSVKSNGEFTLRPLLTTQFQHYQVFL